MADKNAIDGKLGVKVLQLDTVPAASSPDGGNVNFPAPCFTPGTTVLTENNGKWVYCKLPVTVLGSVCIINPLTFEASLITTVLAAAGIGSPVGVAPVANDTAGRYGWLQQRGIIENILTGVAAVNVVLNTTATPGQVDDDGTVGAGLLGPVVLTTARTGSAGVAPAIAGQDMCVTGLDPS